MRVMRGSVRVESSPDGGARFVLSLPVLAHGDGDGDEEGDDDRDGLDGLDGRGDAPVDERAGGSGVKS
jgi:hypothetical protein